MKIVYILYVENLLHYSYVSTNLLFCLAELETHEFPAVYIGGTQQNTKNTKKNTVNRYAMPLPL